VVHVHIDHKMKWFFTIQNSEFLLGSRNGKYSGATSESCMG